jgi:subtilisin family serine protease
MHLLPTRTVLATGAWLVASATLVFSAPKDDLLAAAGSGNSAGVSNALAAGAPVDARDNRGLSALMLAAHANSFSTVRELLWAGADANAKDADGDIALAYLPQMDDETMPLYLLLRCYAYLQTNAKRAAAKPSRPTLVAIMEDTVNYLHPKLKPAYFVNTAELQGQPGKDDDGNGFVDDVYGWTPVLNQPYKIREGQFTAYVRYRDTVAHIIQIDSDRVRGNITAEDAAKRLLEFTNPLSDIMGPVDGLSDGDFLNMVKDAAHGTHVAGIIMDASDGRAQLHTLAVNFAEESRRMLGPQTDKIIDQIQESATDPESLLRELRARLLAHNTARGQIASRYLQWTGAGVVNMSFGGSMPWWRGQALAQVKRFVAHRQEFDASYAPADEELETLASQWGFEMYVANAVELALLFYENPNVLFCAAAGNEDENDDDTLAYPAYLSRFFANVITVAASDKDGDITGFSNFGIKSVNLSAPGLDIESTVIPETTLFMSGTSMATPYVAGVAALVRSLSPEITAGELRRQLEYTVGQTEQLHLYVSSGGNIDREFLRALYTGDARAESNAYARMSITTAGLDDDLYPHHQVDADHYSQHSIDLDVKNAEAWRARAAYFDLIGQHKRAFETIEKAVQLDSRSPMVWVSRALIQENLADNKGAVESLTRCISLLEKIGSEEDNLRSRRLAWRARLELELGRKADAQRDARAARTLNSYVVLTDELEALL